MALVGLACALAVDVQITKEDLWHEVYAIHRVLRDLKLVELSRSFLPTMKELLNELGFDAETDPRYINSEQGLRLLEASSADREVLADIVSQVSKACQKEMKDRSVALELLGGCFERFGFTVNTSRRLPSDMKDAGLAVVTAHGGLNRDKRYLHSIRDDDDLVETPLALAHAFGGVELVILFVCSGGRIDKNPWDNSTTSLPKQLLTRGTRAVIASPWPLEVMVTYSWLEPFLQAWEGGATVLDATKQANDVVDKRLGGVPQCSLAMRVYGDVLLTKSAN